MRIVTACLLALLSAPALGAPKDEGIAKAAAATLDALHDAAARADEAAYFGLFAPDAVFVGTDATEVWSVKAFRDYAHPHFAKGKGWTYRPVHAQRRIRLSEDGRTAWFYEPLLNAKYGEVRGSGVLVREGAAWRVAQYVLSFPIPNDKAADVLKTVRQKHR